MPEKEGAEEKTTKSVVNKKQKQMMGEEGYDIARDQGRVRPSKDKKDATTLRKPPSEEMKNTQIVNTGPSAYELIKKKYKGQIMNVGEKGKKKVQDEFDLTQVAEALGCYITEVEVKGEGPIKKIVKDLKKKGKIDPQADTAVGNELSPNTKAGIEAQARRENLGGYDDAKPTSVRRGTAGKSLEDIKKGLKQDQSDYRDMRKLRAQERRAEKLKDPKFRASETLRKAKQTDIKGGPSVKRGDPVPQEVIPVKKKPVPEIGGFQPNTFKPETGQQTFDKMFGPDSKVRRIQTGEKPVIPDPFGDETKPKKSRKSRTIPFKDRTQLDPETQKKVDAVTPPFATRTGVSGKPLPVSMRNVRVPRDRSIVKAEPSEIEKLKPSQKGNIIVRTKTRTRTQDPGIDPEVTTDSPNQRRAGVGNRTLPGTPPRTGPGFGKRFGQFMDFTRKNPVASLIGYDILRNTAGKIKNQLKPVGVRGGKAIRVSAGR